MRHTAAFLALMLGLAAGVHAQPLRHRPCHPCTMPAFGVDAPRHGVLLARGGVWGAGVSYVRLDLDRRMLARGFVPRPSDGGTVERPEQVAILITPQQAASLMDIVQRIWADPAPLSSAGASDVFWDAWLVDGALMRREHGPGNPPGLAETLENAMLEMLSHYPAAARISG